MKRGEIYYIESTYSESGNEQQSGRPAVIVSNDLCNTHSAVVEVVYLTSQPKKDLPTHVQTRSAHIVPSTILCEQVNSISKTRIGTYVGELTKAELAAVDVALAISLGLEIGGGETVMREPTPEEIKELLKDAKLSPVIPEPENNTAELIRLETERDIYRQLYRDLLETIAEVKRS